MRHRKALRFALAGALAALFLALTWSTFAARISVARPSGSTIEFNNASHTNSTHVAPRTLLPQGAVIITDKLDYHAGEMVTITGTGWQPGETVRLQVDENPNNDGPHIFNPVADSAGNLLDTELVLIAEDQGVSFVLTAVGLSSGQTVTTNFTDAGNLGNGRLSSVVAQGGGCVFDDKVPSSAVESWDIQPGQAYTVTLTNVTDCANGGTDPTIGIVIHSSSTGNTCLTATKTATGIYTFDFTMPEDACLTYPVEYCTVACKPASGMFARRSDGGAKESHLSAATFGANCTNPTVISTCTTTPQGCLLPILDPVNLGCNPEPATIPTCNPGSITPTGCIMGNVTCSSSDSVTGCVHTRTLSYSATGCDGVVCSTSQIITWTNDTTPPTITTCPTGSDLGCNPDRKRTVKG